MDWLEFVAKSEWPIVVISSLLIFRKKLSGLLEDIKPKRFKGFGIEADFDTKLQKAEVLTETTVPPSDAKKDSKKSQSPTMAFDEAIPAQSMPIDKPRQANQSGTQDAAPLVSIIKSYDKLSEVVVRTAIHIFGSTSLDVRDPKRAARKIGFTADELAALDELADIRNTAAHSRNADPSQFDALRYSAIADRLSRRAFDIYLSRRRTDREDDK